jgi:preprotein translocase subunit SecE
VARNRKRRNDRRPTRPGGNAGARPGVATAGSQRTGRDEPADLDGPTVPERPAVTGAPADEEGAPDAIEHATPDVELAEAQLAVGRPGELADAADLAEAEREALASEPAEEDATPSSRVLSTRRQAAPEARSGNRLLSFLQGSWRELQRVQWPDRRQVMQATGVVIGFVIVAGVYLGVADWAATKVVNFILH